MGIDVKVKVRFPPAVCPIFMVGDGRQDAALGSDDGADEMLGSNEMLGVGEGAEDGLLEGDALGLADGDALGLADGALVGAMPVTKAIPATALGGLPVRP